MYCINNNSVEFKTLKDKSGLSDLVLELVCRKFMDSIGRFPHLDEIPSDSSQYLKDNISINKNNSSKTDKILNYTGASSIEEANIKLNNLHEDLEVKLTPLNKETIVEIEKRPTIYRENKKDIETDTSNADANSYINMITDKLSKLYGINIKTIKTSDLQEGEFKNKRIDPKFSTAFIYNGDIYINTDIASLDAPIHELMHLLIGGLRFKHQDLYFDLVKNAEQFKGYDQMKQLYSNRTKTDILEEMFITELSKYLTGQKSQLDNLDQSTIYEISYNTHRMIDTILKGQWSSVSLGDDVYNMSLRSLAEELNSIEMNNTFKGYMDDAYTHRVLANKKQELFEQGKLKEYC